MNHWKNGGAFIWPKPSTFDWKGPSVGDEGGEIFVSLFNPDLVVARLHIELGEDL
jgi:hypothetical protein